MTRLAIILLAVLGLAVTAQSASAATLTINGLTATASGFPTSTTQIEFAVIHTGGTSYFKQPASGGSSSLTVNPASYPGQSSVQIDAHLYRPLPVGPWLGRKTMTFPPPTPATPALSLAPDGRTLTWTAAQGATSYKLATSDAAVAPRTTTYQNVGNVTSFDPPDVAGATRWYGLQAVNASGESGWSNEVSIAYSTPPPSALKLGIMQNHAGGGPSYDGTITSVGRTVFREEGTVDRLITITNEARALGGDVLPLLEYNLAPSEVTRFVNAVHPRWIEVSNEVYFRVAVSAYCTGVQAVAQAARAADPNVKIIVSAATPDQGVPASWEDGLAACQSSFDYLAIHPYRLRNHDPSWAFNHNAVATTLQKFPSKQVAITEVGWPTADPVGNGYTPAVSESQQATFMNSLVPEVVQVFPNQVPLVIVYRFNQAGNTGTIEGYFSIQGKPAETSFRQACATYC